MDETGIFLRKNDGELIQLPSRQFGTEDRLQQLIEEHPEILAGDQVDPSAPRRWILIAREMGVPGTPDSGDRWSLDHLFLDQDGIPTLVEAKRSSDPRSRREVVAQMLDYASNASLHWNVERLQRDFADTCKRSGRDPSEVLSDCLGESEDEADTFWSRVDANLRARRLRLVFVADRISHHLQRIIEFLNEQMAEVDVIAIEIRQFMANEDEVFVPRVIGQTAAATAKSSKRRGQGPWDESAFLESLAEACGNATVTRAKRIIEWARQHGMSEGGTAPRFIPALIVGTYSFRPLVLKHDGMFVVRTRNFINKVPPFDSLEVQKDFRNRLEETGIKFTGTENLKRSWIDTLDNESQLESVLSVLTWALTRVQTLNAGSKPGGAEQ